ncbi:MAG: hypothetical protein ACRBF0_23860 [Calditrichia bacterium]
MKAPFIKGTIIAVLLLLLMCLSSASAQQKLHVHGYFSQAYAISDGNSIYGISSNGTVDYRNAALQFSFQPSQANRVVIQVNHQRIGQSPIMPLKEDVELDWGILEQRLNDTFTLRAGRILLPLGMYNQMRDVGILLPFYSVPFSPYGEGIYTSETVDGFSVSVYKDVGESSSIEAEVYFGQWKWAEWYILDNIFGGPQIAVADEATIRAALGAWLWFNTPVEGLRLGSGGFSGNVEDGIQFQPDELLGPQRMGLIAGAVDFTRSRFYLRSEVNAYQLFKSSLTAVGGYIQFGIHITDRLEINSQNETTHVKNLIAIPNTPAKDVEYNRDFALGIKFSPTHFLALKIEGHLNRGYLAEQPLSEILYNRPYKTRYAILSLSVGF